MTRPRRAVVHLTTYLQGGAGRAITDLACAQHRAGDDVLVMASATGRGDADNYPEYLDRLAAAGVTVVLEESLFVRDAVLGDRALACLHRARRPEDVAVVHAHAATPARIGLRFAEATDGRPVVIQTQHGWGTRKTPAQAQDDLATLHAVDHVITTSRATGGWLVSQGLDPARLSVIPCGLVKTSSGPMPGDAVAYLAAHRADGRRLAACIGSVTANKNQALLVEALADPRTAGWAGVVIGEGGDALRPRAEALGVAARLALAGYQAGAARWLAGVDLLVVPSLSEGQGLVVLEAFRAGVPVVASRIPALEELVVEGETGWLFDPTDARDLVRALTAAGTALPAVRARIVAAARGVFMRDYRFETTLARHEALYARLAGPGAAARVPGAGARHPMSSPAGRGEAHAGLTRGRPAG